MSCVEITQVQEPLAQLAEHLTLNQGVQGSNPWRRTKDYKIRFVVFFLLYRKLRLLYDKNAPQGCALRILFYHFL